MSKKLFTTVMVMAVLLAGVAMAGEMHYKVYGKAHVSTEMLNNGDESSIFVSSNSSRLGIKGAYETDVEALTVIFQIESAADFNGENANTLASRNSFAGVKGEWGQLIWGRHDTPMKTLGRKVDFFGDRVGDARNATAYFGDGWDQRPTDMIMYTTPLLGECVTVNAQYVPEEGYLGEDSNTFFSANAIYNKDGIMVGAAFESHGEALEGGAESSTGIRAAAKYTADMFTVAGLFQSISNVGGIEDVSATTFGIGAEYRLENGFVPKAQYYMFDANTDIDDDAASMLTLGVDYKLNKMATLYVAYAMMMNEDNASYAPWGGGHKESFNYVGETASKSGNTGAMMGESASGLAVGLIAKF